MKLPETVKVGGMPFSVKIDDDLLNDQDENSNGLIDYHQGRILLKKTKVFQQTIVPFPASRIIESFFHEILHAIDFIFCFGDFTEDQIELLTTGLICVIKENNLNFGSIPFRKPNKIKILGFYHKITYSTRRDSDIAICQSSDTLAIFITSSVCDHLVKHRLLSCILGAITAQLEIDIEMDILMKFAMGVLQVFSDIPIEKLIKEN